MQAASIQTAIDVAITARLETQFESRYNSLIAENKLRNISLLATIQQTNATLARLEELIKSDIIQKKNILFKIL